MNSSTSEDPLLGATLLGRYTVRQALGEGGMGRVYLADQQIGTVAKRVAIKTLHPTLSRDESIVKRFRRECETVAQLSHPNTVSVFDFGTLDDGTLVIVMEFIEGITLADVLEQGPVAPERVERILKQVCGSVGEAHKKGFVHRDLKPENIMLTDRAGQNDFVKVLDFGIARISDEDTPAQVQTRLTMQGSILGTPPYMSPEQFKNAQLDTRSDVYSLGIVAYEMLTGNLPFEANTPFEFASQHLQAAPLELETYLSAEAINPSHKRAIMRALEKDPKQRQSTAADFFLDFSGSTTTQAPVRIQTQDYGTSGQASLNRSQAFTHEPTLAQPAYTENVALPLKSRRRWIGWGAGSLALFGVAAIAAYATGGFGSAAQPTITETERDISQQEQPPSPATTSTQDPTSEGKELAESPAAAIANTTATPTPNPSGKATAKQTPPRRSTPPKQTKPPAQDPKGSPAADDTSKNRAIDPAVKQRFQSYVQAGNLAKSAAQLKVAQQQGGTDHPDVKQMLSQLATYGKNKVGFLVQQHKCSAAKKALHALKTVSAHKPAAPLLVGCK